MRRLALILMSLLVLSGCDQTMKRQNRADINRTTPSWPGGQTARDLPHHVVALGYGAWIKAEQNKPKVTAALMARGQSRYRVYCEPCHGFDGNGRGQVVQHGYPYPGSLNSRASRALEAQQIFHIISRGKGKMFGYARQIAPRDRWAIVAYIRALQLSQRAKLAAFKGLREKLP